MKLRLRQLLNELLQVVLVDIAATVHSVVVVVVGGGAVGVVTAGVVRVILFLVRITSFSLQNQISVTYT